ncbi:salicylate hydroxylase [Mycena polygramma]|nr:salicylate hydroxylase [Mycena polygramma]
MSTFRLRIAIVGAGPGGLALGRLLYQHGICPTIYELRPKPTQAELAQVSGMLDLHTDSGLRAMRECGLWDSFQAALGNCSEESRVLNFDGTVLFTDDGANGTRPEIPRNALMHILTESVPSDCIKWNHKVTGVRSAHNPSTGAVEVTLDLGANGAATYDFVVGADGAWSRVRPLLSPAHPIYNGPQLLTATILSASTKYPHLVELCGSGAIHARGHGHSVGTHRGPQDSIRLYIAIGTPEERWAAAVGLEGKTAAEAKATLLGDEKLFAKWSPALQDLIGTACDEESKTNPGAVADIKPMYTLPVGHRWEQHAGATLIGDAAHLTVPSGEGVNLALRDALELAHVLIALGEAANAKAWQAALEPRVREFEEAMLARGESSAEEAIGMWKMFLGENAAQRMADFFKGAVAAAAAK